MDTCRMTALVLFAYVGAAWLAFGGIARAKGLEANCPPERAMQSAVAHRERVHRYQRADAAAVDETRSFSSDDLEIVRRGVFAPKLCRADPPWSARELEAAAMLETDAAEAALAEQDLERMMNRLDGGRRLLLGLPSESRGFLELWYLAVARRLRLAGLVSPWAAEFLSWARGDVEASAPILLESARVAELSASGASTLQVTAGRTRVVIPATIERQQNRFYESSLDAASNWLRQSARLEPDAGTDLRLARVLLARGDLEAAHAILERSAAASDSRYAYLARLFVGFLHERKGRLDDALASYQEAGRVFPAAQSWRMLAGRLLFERGDAAGAARMLSGFEATGDAEDPWWDYFYDSNESVAAELHALRIRVMDR
jgi:tetratricopeptide (TPR) repeat protein